jgi:hypothetical protein
MDAPPRLKPWAIFRFSLRETSRAGDLETVFGTAFAGEIDAARQ